MSAELTAEDFCICLYVHDTQDDAENEVLREGCSRYMAEVVEPLLDRLAEQTRRADDLAAKVAAVEAVCASPDDTQWWPVQPYIDPPNDDEVTEVEVVSVERVRAALTSGGDRA